MEFYILRNNPPVEIIFYLDGNKWEIKGNASNATIQTEKLKSKEPEDELFNAAIDGIESMVLSCYCAGIDIISESFIKALHNAIESCCNNIP